MKTKDKILHTSITMFNERGFGSISLRDIAVEMKISPGNLTYHYRNRSDLLDAIYEQMYQEMEVFFKQETADPLEIIYKIPGQSKAFFHRYRFFFSDLKSIFQEFPALAERHRLVVSKRLLGGQMLLKSLLEDGYLKPEPHPDAYQYLVHLFWMVPTFWYSQHPVLPENHPARDMSFLQETISGLIRPYLTPIGIDKWNQLTNKYNETN